jgi:voltage-gated potassium channel
MTAKEINPNLLLAARAQEEEAVARLKRIGADIVVQPQIEGGKQLVNAILGKN